MNCSRLRLLQGDSTSKNPADWTVRVGEHSFKSKEEKEKRLGVRQIIIHPGYKRSNSSHPGDNDIGMIKKNYLSHYTVMRGFVADTSYCQNVRQSCLSKQHKSIEIWGMNVNPVVRFCDFGNS